MWYLYFKKKKYNHENYRATLKSMGFEPYFNITLPTPLPNSQQEMTTAAVILFAM